MLTQAYCRNAYSCKLQTRKKKKERVPHKIKMYLFPRKYLSPVMTSQLHET